MPAIDFKTEELQATLIPDGSVTSPAGFRGASAICGLKVSGRPDLAVIASNQPAVCAGVFTSNRVYAACVALSREHAAGGRAQVIVVNSGNANCYTGRAGYEDAIEVCAMAARETGTESELVLEASTGHIGERLPMDKMEAGIRDACARLSPEGGLQAAEAIMTTDTVRKSAAVEVSLSGGAVRIGVIAKGSGMIEPNLATMLCFITTDAQVAPEMLQQMLKSAAGQSLNCLTVDGDTSTNDMALMLANGASGVSVKETERPAFQSALDWLLRQMARAMAADGEGATKLVEVRVTGAASDADAKLAAKTIANSPLVKTAIFGGDPNWGRILAAAGRSGAAMDQEKASLSISGRQIVECGEPLAVPDNQARQMLEPLEIPVVLDLGLGSGSAVVWTCDMSYDYVRINAEYHT